MDVQSDHHLLQENKIKQNNKDFDSDDYMMAIVKLLEL
jgi:hypothetical protein